MNQRMFKVERIARIQGEGIRSSEMEAGGWEAMASWRSSGGMRIGISNVAVPEAGAPMVVSMRDGMKGSALGGRGWFRVRGTGGRRYGWSATQPRSGGQV